MSDPPIATVSTKKSIERRVIFLYKNNPFLWKKTHPRYSDYGLKRYALEKISFHLKITKQELTSHIRIITNRINQIVRNLVEVKGGVIMMKSKYEHFIDCQFLFDELLRRRRKKDETKQRSTPTDICQPNNDRLLCEGWIFTMVMDHRHTLGASDDNQIDWDEISLLVNIKALFKMSPAIARSIWTNLSKSIFESYEQIKEAHQGTPSGLETVWDALEELVPFSGFVLDLYVEPILELYIKKKHNKNNNQFLFDLISKYPCLMRKSKKDKKEAKRGIWDEITISYNRTTNNKIEASLLIKQWNQLLRKVESRMKIFNKWILEDSDSVTICAPTDLEKKILKCYPRLLLGSFSTSSFISDGQNCENGGFEEVNQDTNNSIFTEEIDNSESTGKMLSNEEKASSRLESNDINIGERDYAYICEINKDFLDDLEIKHITSGINSPEDQLNEEDVSFLLVKWLGQDLKIKEKVESDLTSYNIHSEIWENLAEKILPFSSLHTPESLYSRWRDIFVDTLYNFQFSKRRPAEMTSMDWIVMQSFPNLFVEKAEGLEDHHSNNDFVCTPVEDSSQSQSPVPQHDKDIPEKSNSQSSMDDDDRSHDCSGGLHMSDTKSEQSTCNKDLPELKRHQKPIILSDMTEVLKMNRQLQTASVAPSLSTKRGHKMVILKNCEKGGQINWWTTDCRVCQKPDKNKLSYRPNPKYSKDIPDWMKKSIALLDDALPVVPLRRKEDAAYQNFLEVLQSFSKFDTSLLRNVHKVTNDEIFAALALHKCSDAPPKVVFESKDIVISESDDNPDNVWLDYSDKMDAQKMFSKKKRTRSEPKKTEEGKKDKADEDRRRNMKIKYLKKVSNYKMNTIKKMQAREECKNKTLYFKKVSNSNNSKVVVTSDILNNTSNSSMNKKSVKQTRKLQNKRPVKKQMKLMQYESENQDSEYIGLILNTSNNVPSTSMVLTPDPRSLLLNSSLEVPTDPIPPPASDAVSQVPEPRNLDLRSYYSMVADSLLDMSNLDNIELDIDNNLRSNPVMDLVNVSDTLTNKDRSSDYLSDMNTMQSPKTLIETITLPDSDDDIPLSQFTK